MAGSLQGGDDEGGTLGTSSVLAEINVTPFVDVMLVLLVIFMITAPLMTQGHEVQLPQTSAQTLEQGEEEPLILTIDAELRIWVGEESFTLQEMETKLPLIFENRTDKNLFVRADRMAPYGFVSAVMAAAKRGGVVEVGLVTDPGDGLGWPVEGQEAGSSEGAESP